MATEYEEQGYPEWIDLIESLVYVNAEVRVHRDFSSQSGLAGFSALTPATRPDRVYVSLNS